MPAKISFLSSLGGFKKEGKIQEDDDGEETVKPALGMDSLFSRIT
jgi:hypothetical protein